MLAELQNAHDRLLAGIQELEDATKADVPDPSLLAAIRWRLSRVSGERRRLVEAASAHLLQQAPETAPKIDRLRENHAEMRHASSQHVGSWPIARITGDWDGYRLASAEMRKSMRARIGLEQTILYPLIEQY